MKEVVGPGLLDVCVYSRLEAFRMNSHLIPNSQPMKSGHIFAPSAAKPEQDVLWWHLDSLHHWHQCGNTDLDVPRHAGLTRNAYSQERAGKSSTLATPLFQWPGSWKYLFHSFSPLDISDISSIMSTNPWSKLTLRWIIILQYIPKIRDWVLDIFHVSLQNFFCQSFVTESVCFF